VVASNAGRRRRVAVWSDQSSEPWRSDPVSATFPGHKSLDEDASVFQGAQGRGARDGAASSSFYPIRHWDHTSAPERKIFASPPAVAGRRPHMTCDAFRLAGRTQPQRGLDFDLTHRTAHMVTWPARLGDGPAVDWSRWTWRTAKTADVPHRTLSLPSGLCPRRGSVAVQAGDVGQPRAKTQRSRLGWLTSQEGGGDGILLPAFDQGNDAGGAPDSGG